jgi:hypothetical protein
MNWKLTALASTALVALGSAAAMATGPMMMGVVNLETGHTWQDDDEPSFDPGECDDCDGEFMNLSGGVDVNIPLAGGVVNVLLSARGDSAYANEDDDHNFGTSFTMTGGLDYRDDTGTVGPFVTFGRVSSIDEDTASFYGGGVQGLFFCGDWNLGGQLGFLTSSEGRDGGEDNEFFHSAVYARGIAEYYFGQNTKVGGSLAYASGDQDDSGADLWEWQLRAERMFGRSVPVTYYVEYRGVHAEERDFTEETNNHTVSIGINFLLNATDLKQANRHGVTITPTDFGRWVSEAGEQID